jgi:hypothetical protein
MSGLLPVSAVRVHAVEGGGSFFCSTWNSYSHPTPFHVKLIGRKDPR